MASQTSSPQSSSEPLPLIRSASPGSTAVSSSNNNSPSRSPSPNDSRNVTDADPNLVVQWTKVPVLTWTPPMISNIAATVHNNELYVFGGISLFGVSSHSTSKNKKKKKKKRTNGKIRADQDGARSGLLASIRIGPPLEVEEEDVDGNEEGRLRKTAKQEEEGWKVLQASGNGPTAKVSPSARSSAAMFVQGE